MEGPANTPDRKIVVRNIWDEGPPDYINLPWDYGCDASKIGHLYLTATPFAFFPAGYYKLQVSAKNPANENAGGATWTMGTYKDVKATYGTLNEKSLDGQISTPDFPILGPMPAARLIRYQLDPELENDIRWATRRDDRML